MIEQGGDSNPEDGLGGNKKNLDPIEILLPVTISDLALKIGVKNYQIVEFLVLENIFPSPSFVFVNVDLLKKTCDSFGVKVGIKNK